MLPDNTRPEDDEYEIYMELAPECTECEGSGEVVGSNDEDITCSRCQGSGIDETLDYFDE